MNIKKMKILLFVIFSCQIIILFGQTEIQIKELGISGVVFDSSYRGIVLQSNSNGICQLNGEEIIAGENLIREKLVVDSMIIFLGIKKESDLDKFTRQYHCELVDGNKVLVVLLMKENWIGKPKPVFRGWRKNSLYSTSDSFRKQSRLLLVNLATGKIKY